MNFFILTLLFFCSAGSLRGEESSSATVKSSTVSPILITIVYPQEGSQISNLKESFVFGSVKPANSQVWVNDKPAKVYNTGSYLAVIPFSAGQFAIKALAKQNDRTGEALRMVQVASLPIVIPSFPLKIDTAAVEPAQETIVTPGDAVPISLRASSGSQLDYRIRNLEPQEHATPWISLPETPLGSGYYATEWLAPSNAHGQEAYVDFRASNALNEKAKAAGPGKIKIMDPALFRLARVSVPESILRPGPSIGNEMMGYDLFLKEGITLKISGQKGDEVRVQLSSTEEGWTHLKNVAWLPENAPASAPV